MTSSTVPASVPVGWGDRALAAVAVALLAGLVIAAGLEGRWKLLTIALVSFGSMALGALLGLRAVAHGRGLTWAHGLASGAMVASACAFLLPVALGQHPQLGGFGVAGGLLAGFAVHTLGEQLVERQNSFDDTVLRLTVHAIGAGAVVGTIYTRLPEVGLLLGLSIISHKAPAGYVAAQQLRRRGRSVLPLALPATGVGIPAVALGLLGASPVGQFTAVMFGLAAGIFLHVALEFLPHPERGQPRAAGGHRLAPHAAASAVLGASAVVIAWALVSS